MKNPSRRFQSLELLPSPTSSLWKISLALLLAASSLRAQDAVNYEEHIKPLFRSHCNQCHNPDKAKGGLDMSTFGGLLKGGGSGVGLISGDPDGSLLYLSMTHAKEPFMPKEGDKRPAAELDLVKRWIQGGLIEKRGGVARTSEKPKISFDASALVGAKPEGPPPMPKFESEKPVFVSDRANAIRAIAASPWAPLVAVGGSQQIVLHNPDTSDLLATIPFPEGDPTVLRFSRNAKLLMAGGGVAGQSGKVVVWDVTTGERVADVGEEYDSVLAADIRADQKLVALGGPLRVIRAFNTASGEKVYEIKKHTEWVTAMEFSPDGILLASGDRNGGLFIWEADNGMPFFDLAGHQGAITRVSWRGDGNVLASASEDGNVKLWNAHDGKQAKSFAAHAGGVQWVEFMRDGRLVTCGRDKTVKIWSTDGTVQKTLTNFTDITTAVIGTHNSARVIAGDWSGQLKVFASSDGGFTGRLRANPPSITALIEDAAALREPAQKRYTELKTLSDQAAAALTAKQNELEAARKFAADKAARIPAAEAALAAARKDADDAAGQLAAAKQELQNREADLAMRNERARQASEREAKSRSTRDDLQRQLAEHGGIIAEMKKLVAAAEATALPTQNDKAVFDQLENSARKQKDSEAQHASLTQRIPAVTADFDKAVAEARDANSVIKAGQDAVAQARTGADQKQAAASQSNAKKDEAEKSLASAKAESEQAAKNQNEKQAASDSAKQAATSAADIAASAQQDLINADKRSDRLKAEQFDALIKKAQARLTDDGDDVVPLDQVVDAAMKAVETIEPAAPPKKEAKKKDAALRPSEPPRAILFLGRFHMVMLHLPIGALLLAMLLELDRFIRRTEQTDYIITQTLRFGAAFAVISAALGWLLSFDPAYEPAELSLHMWLGFAATAAALIAAWMRNHPHTFAPTIYWTAMLSTTVLLALAGHEGGNLTHGRGFLTQYYPDFVATFKSGSTTTDTSEFATQIRPILDQHCIKCHGPEKDKGDLRLDLKDKALGAGESGKRAIIPGNALKSEAVIRMLLARDHDDVMPPSNKPAMKSDEIFTLINWINEGAEWPDAPAPAAPKTNAVSTTKAAPTSEVSTMTAPMDATHGAPKAGMNTAPASTNPPPTSTTQPTK